MKSSRFRFSLLAASIAVVAIAVWVTRAPEERVVLPAIEADAFVGLQGRTGAVAPELWERLKAMGVAAVLLREETVAELAARGEVLHFSRPEVEKWRALGLIAVGAGPKSDSLWTKDAKAMARITGALAARGIDASAPVERAAGASAPYGAALSLQLPSGVDLARVPAGFEPETVSAVSAAGLIPIAASTGSVFVVAGQKLWIRTLPVSARAPELMRAVNGRAMRLVVLRPSSGAGLDENLARLREALRIIKSAGQSAVLPAVAPHAVPGGLEAVVRLFLFFAIGLFGPLLAVRAGLQSERAIRPWIAARAPMASPVPEILAGTAAAWATASVAGLLAAASLAPERREELSRVWTLWTLAAPLFVGSAALFAGAGSDLRARWRRPLRIGDFGYFFALAAALIVLLAPRATLRAAGIWESADRLSAAADALWWWPWRWREILIGTPSLVVALILVGGREAAAEAGDEEAPPRFLADPRGWLALGLLAPAGAVAAIGAGGAPPTLAVLQGAAACALGLGLGLLLFGLRTRIDKWVFRPNE